MSAGQARANRSPPAYRKADRFHSLRRAAEIWMESPASTARREPSVSPTPASTTNNAAARPSNRLVRNRSQSGPCTLSGPAPIAIAILKLTNTIPKMAKARAKS